MITLQVMRALCPRSRDATFAPFVDPLNATIAEFSIVRVAEFLAQIAHESGGFVFLRELWGPTPQQARYEGRADLGNTQPGDGFRYRGRGLIQITGRANTRDCGLALDLPLEDNPEYLERPMVAARSAGWFWKSRKLDAIDDFTLLTKRVNGGTNGLADRYAYFGRAKLALADPSPGQTLEA